MPSLEGLKRKIQSTEDLHSVVKTMKALAAVNIRQFENAVSALQSYSRTVEWGLQAVVRNRPGFSITARSAQHEGLGAVVFGTDQGMCGPFNDTVVSFALETIDGMKFSDAQIRIAVVGSRAAGRFHDEGRRPHQTFSVPGSVEAMTPLVQNLILWVESWLDRDVGQVVLFHNSPESGASYRPRQVRLLPLDRQWLQDIRSRPWPDNQLPWFSMEWDELFDALIRQYLFVSLYRAAAESLAAENASRLATMQGAESSIEERFEALQGQFHRERQMGITEELQDIVSGFEALRN